jgi:hypothetical protein
MRGRGRLILWEISGIYVEYRWDMSMSSIFDAASGLKTGCKPEIIRR